MDGVAERYLQRLEPLEALAARPHGEEAFDGDGDDGCLGVNGKNGRAFLECLRHAVDRAFALGVEDQREALVEPECSGAHGGDEIGVGIHDHDPQRPRQMAHEALAENIAGADRKQFAEHAPRHDRSENERVEISLMI